jgi:hypothetical protein
MIKITKLIKVNDTVFQIIDIRILGRMFTSLTRFLQKLFKKINGYRIVFLSAQSTMAYRQHE